MRTYNATQIEIKNLKSWEGMEGIGTQCSVYFNGKKVGTFTDDAFGGEPRIEGNFTEVYKYLNSLDVKGAMYKNGWDFYDNKDCIDDASMLTVIIEQEADFIELKKTHKRNSKKNILFGNANSFEFRKVSWKRAQLIEVKTKVPEVFENTILKYLTKLNEGEQILNTNIELFEDYITEDNKHLFAYAK